MAFEKKYSDELRDADPEDHFNRTLDWVASWGLVDAENDFVKLVDSTKLLQGA